MAETPRRLGDRDLIEMLARTLDNPDLWPGAERPAELVLVLNELDIHRGVARTPNRDEDELEVWYCSCGVERQDPVCLTCGDRELNIAHVPDRGEANARRVADELAAEDDQRTWSFDHGDSGFSVINLEWLEGAVAARRELLANCPHHTVDDDGDCSRCGVSGVSLSLCGACSVARGFGGIIAVGDTCVFCSRNQVQSERAVDDFRRGSMAGTVREAIGDQAADVLNGARPDSVEEMTWYCSCSYELEVGDTCSACGESCS